MDHRVSRAMTSPMTLALVLLALSSPSTLFASGSDPPLDSCLNTSDGEENGGAKCASADGEQAEERASHPAESPPPQKPNRPSGWQSGRGPTKTKPLHTSWMPEEWARRLGPTNSSESEHVELQGSGATENDIVNGNLNSTDQTAGGEERDENGNTGSSTSLAESEMVLETSQLSRQAALTIKVLEDAVDARKKGLATLVNESYETLDMHSNSNSGSPVGESEISKSTLTASLSLFHLARSFLQSKIEGEGSRLHVPGRRWPGQKLHIDLNKLHVTSGFQMVQKRYPFRQKYADVNTSDMLQSIGSMLNVVGMRVEREWNRLKRQIAETNTKKELYRTELNAWKERIESEIDVLIGKMIDGFGGGGRFFCEQTVTGSTEPNMQRHPKIPNYNLINLGVPLQALPGNLAAVVTSASESQSSACGSPTKAGIRLWRFGSRSVIIDSGSDKQVFRLPDLRLSTDVQGIDENERNTDAKLANENGNGNNGSNSGINFGNFESRRDLDRIFRDVEITRRMELMRQKMGEGPEGDSAAAEPEGPEGNTGNSLLESGSLKTLNDLLGDTISSASSGAFVDKSAREGAIELTIMESAGAGTAGGGSATAGSKTGKRNNSSGGKSSSTGGVHFGPCHTEPWIDFAKSGSAGLRAALTPSRVCVYHDGRLAQVYAISEMFRKNDAEEAHASGSAESADSDCKSQSDESDDADSISLSVLDGTFVIFNSKLNSAFQVVDPLRDQTQVLSIGKVMQAEILGENPVRKAGEDPVSDASPSVKSTSESTTIKIARETLLMSEESDGGEESLPPLAYSSSSISSIFAIHDRKTGGSAVSGLRKTLIAEREQEREEQKARKQEREEQERAREREMEEKARWDQLEKETAEKWGKIGKSLKSGPDQSTDKNEPSKTQSVKFVNNDTTDNNGDSLFGKITAFTDFTRRAAAGFGRYLAYNADTYYTSYYASPTESPAPKRRIESIADPDSTTDSKDSENFSANSAEYLPPTSDWLLLELLRFESPIIALKHLGIKHRYVAVLENGSVLLLALAPNKKPLILRRYCVEMGGGATNTTITTVKILSSEIVPVDYSLRGGQLVDAADVAYLESLDAEAEDDFDDDSDYDAESESDARGETEGTRGQGRRFERDGSLYGSRDASKSRSLQYGSEYGSKYTKHKPRSPPGQLSARSYRRSGRKYRATHKQTTLQVKKLPNAPSLSERMQVRRLNAKRDEQLQKVYSRLAGSSLRYDGSRRRLRGIFKGYAAYAAQRRGGWRRDLRVNEDVNANANGNENIGNSNQAINHGQAQTKWEKTQQNTEAIRKSTNIHQKMAERHRARRGRGVGNLATNKKLNLDRNTQKRLSHNAPGRSTATPSFGPQAFSFSKWKSYWRQFRSAFNVKNVLFPNLEDDFSAIQGDRGPHFIVTAEVETVEVESASPIARRWGYTAAFDTQRAWTVAGGNSGSSVTSTASCSESSFSKISPAWEMKLPNLSNPTVFRQKGDYHVVGNSAVIADVGRWAGSESWTKKSDNSETARLQNLKTQSTDSTPNSNTDSVSDVTDVSISIPPLAVLDFHFLRLAKENFRLRQKQTFALHPYEDGIAFVVLLGFW